MIPSGLMLNLSSRALHNPLSVYSDRILLLIQQDVWLQHPTWKVRYSNQYWCPTIILLSGINHRPCITRLSNKSWVSELTVEVCSVGIWNHLNPVKRWGNRVMRWHDHLLWSSMTNLAQISRRRGDVKISFHHSRMNQILPSTFWGVQLLVLTFLSTRSVRSAKMVILSYSSTEAAICIPTYLFLLFLRLSH